MRRFPWVETHGYHRRSLRDQDELGRSCLRDSQWNRNRISYPPLHEPVLPQARPGPDAFVFDWAGNKHPSFNPKDFDPADKDRLWDVGESKGGPPPGLFFKDARGTVHRLIDHPLNQDYALSKDGKYIGTSTWDQRVRVHEMRT